VQELQTIAIIIGHFFSANTNSGFHLSFIGREPTNARQRRQIVGINLVILVL